MVQGIRRIFWFKYSVLPAFLGKTTQIERYLSSLQRGDVMSTETDDNALLDGIAELILIPIQTGQAKKVEAQIIVEVDEKDGKVKLSATINSAKEEKK